MEMKDSIPKKRRTDRKAKLDYLEQLPDEVLLHIIDLVFKSSDIKTLFRLRILSHRFNSLVIDKTKHLFLQVDKFHRIFGIDMDAPNINKFAIRKAFLRCFKHVTKLVIELPAFNVDYRNPPPKHEVKLMCKATFGKNLRNSCVILCYNATECHCKAKSPPSRDSCPFLLTWSKLFSMQRLIRKCAFIAMNLVPHLENLVSLVLKDSKGDLEMVMDNEEEIREGTDRDTYNYCYGDDGDDDDDDNARVRVVKPVGWYGHRIMTNMDECGGTVGQETMALAVVAGPYYKEIDDAVDADLVKRAFGSEVHGVAIDKLLHNTDPAYLQRFGPG